MRIDLSFEEIDALITVLDSKTNPQFDGLCRARAKLEVALSIAAKEEMVIEQAFKKPTTQRLSDRPTQQFKICALPSVAAIKQVRNKK